MSDNDVRYGDEDLEPIKVVRLRADTGGDLHPFAIGQLVNAMVTLSDWALTVASEQPDRFVRTRPRVDYNIRNPSPDEYEQLVGLLPFEIVRAPFLRTFSRPSDSTRLITDPTILRVSYNNPVEVVAAIGAASETASKAAGLLTVVLHPIRSWKASGARLDTQMNQAREASARADREQLAAVRDAANMPPISLGLLRAAEERYPGVASLLGADHLNILERVRATTIAAIAAASDAPSDAAFQSADNAQLLGAIAVAADADTEGTAAGLVDT